MNSGSTVGPWALGPMGNVGQWIARLRLGVGRLGLVGWAGLALLCASAWGQWHKVPQRLQDAASLASQARGLRHALQADARLFEQAPSAAIEQPEPAWRALWAALPQAESRPALQAAVLQAARSRGLQMPTVQYQGQLQAWASQGGTSLWRERMVMPVQGPYVAVQAWVEDMLREPALSVDALSIQRDSVQSGTVSAQVSVSLWWRQPSEARR
ncbi:MAG: hypothetical protein RI907_1990 [Pseudomonadota bacterium]|jgi:hypothetical protein